MILSLVCAASVLGTGPLRNKLLDAAVVRWIGLSTAQINEKLREKPSANSVAGGTKNLQVSSHYANARLVVSYKDGIAVNIYRTK